MNTKNEYIEITFDNFTEYYNKEVEVSNYDFASESVSEVKLVGYDNSSHRPVITRNQNDWKRARIKNPNYRPQSSDDELHAKLMDSKNWVRIKDYTAFHRVASWDPYSVDPYKIGGPWYSLDELRNAEITDNPERVK